MVGTSTKSVLRFAKEEKGGISFTVSKTGLLSLRKLPSTANEKSFRHIAFGDDKEEDINLMEEPIILKFDKEFFGYWGTHGLDENPWIDENAPVVKFKKFDDLKLKRKERQGFLTDRIIASCSSYLDKCPDTQKYALCKCELSRKNLKDISLLYYHHFLQYVDLSYNNLKDVSALSGLPYLMHLDVSHNKLRQLLNFEPPKNLTFVDYSFNMIRKIKDLSPFWSIKVLNLSYNLIEKINGLENLRYLENLNLSHNAIKRIENLNHLRILHLNLAHNQISSFQYGPNTGLHTMPLLSYLFLNNNKLKTLELFQKCAFLQSLDLEFNCISQLLELNYIKDLKFLVYLNLNGNHITARRFYHVLCFDLVKNLSILDCLPVDVREKVLASLYLNPDVEQRASLNYTHLILQSHFNATYKNLKYYPDSDKNISWIVLVAPDGCNHQYLLEQLLAVNKGVIRVDHYTTKFTGFKDEFYLTDTVFNEKVRSGEFLMVYKRFGYKYGLGRSDVFHGLSCLDHVMITDGNLQAGLTLRLGCLKPKLLLAIPSSRTAYKKILTQIYTASNHKFSVAPEAMIVSKLKNRKSMESKKLFIYKDLWQEPDNNCNCLEDFNEEEEEEFETVCRCGEKYLGEETESNTIEHDKQILNEYFEEILQQYDEYLNYHLDHPGVFYDVLFTDDLDDSLQKFNKILSEIQEDRVEIK